MEGRELNLPFDNQVFHRVQVRGDQVAARECYIAMLEMDDHLQTMCIEEQRMIVEPVEGFEEVLLDDARLERTTKIGTLASQPM